MVVTDGRATAGAGRAGAVPAGGRRTSSGLGIDAVVVDCETGRMSLGLARGLADDLRAQYVPLAEVNAEALAGVAAGGRVGPLGTAAGARREGRGRDRPRRTG